ncbi:MAG: putative membrane protein [Pseudohongiellaceae bacterium]|jgi:uncharacterized membrane protein
MGKTRFIFSVVVGVSLLVVGAVIASKATIGMALMVLGLSLIGVAIVARNIGTEYNMQSELVAIKISTCDGSR